MSNLYGWLAPTVRMHHPEGQRSLTYCNSSRARGIPTTVGCNDGLRSYYCLGYPKQSYAIGTYPNQYESIGINLNQSELIGTSRSQSEPIGINQKQSELIGLIPIGSDKFR